VTRPPLDDQLRRSAALGVAAAVDWEARCARAEGQRDAARDLVCDIAGYAQNPQIPMPRALHERLCATVRLYSSEARGDDAPSPIAGSGGGPPAPAHHTTASDPDDRVIVVLTRSEAAVMAGQLDAVARMLSDDGADTRLLTAGELDEIAAAAAARHLEGAPADTSPYDVMCLVDMARGAR